MSRTAWLVLGFGLLVSRLQAGEVYEVWGGDPDVTWGDVDMWSGYTKLGSSTSTAFFAGSYSNYVIATRSRVGVDAIMGSDGTYGSQTNQADPWWYSGFTNLYGPPDDVLYVLGYLPSNQFIRGQVSFKGTSWTGLTVYVKDLPPDAPSVVVSQGDYTNRVVLTWRAVEGASVYRVARNNAPYYNGATNIYTGTATNLVDTNVADRVPNYYWVQATNYAGSSLPGRGHLGYSLTPSGTATRLWTRVWGTSQYSSASALIMDSTGGVYVVGSTSDGLDGQPHAGGDDAYMIKFTTNGASEWTRLWGSGDGDYPGTIASDNAGGLYVVGSTDGSFDGQTNQGRDAFLTKFTTNGTREWSRIWGSTDYGYAKSIAVLGTNIYVSGFDYGAFDGQTNEGAANVFLSKFSPSGQRVWTRMWGGQEYSFGYALAVSTNHDIYVAGQTYSNPFDGEANPAGYAAFLSKFNADGDRLWSRLLTNGPAMEATAVAVHPTGTIYVAGADGISTYLAQFTPAGTQTAYSVRGGNYASALKFSSVGELLTVADGGYGAVLLSKSSPAGVELYNQSWKSADTAYARDLLITPSADIYIVGRTYGPLGGQPLFGDRASFLSKWREGDWGGQVAMQTLGIQEGQPGGVVTGAPGADYSVEFSTNLQEWTTVLVTNLPAMPFNWQDTNAPANPAYYRSRFGPP